MPRFQGHLRTAVVLVLGLVGTLPLLPACGGENATVKAVRIGVVDSLFANVSSETAEELLRPFQVIVQNHTGLSGEVVLGGEADTLAKQLAENKVQLAVFHGFELSWARLKYPSLKPLVLAVNKQPQLRAYLVTRKDSAATSLTDLKGQSLIRPARSRPHCLLFLERRCVSAGAKPAEFFSRVSRANSTEEALNAVAEGRIQVVLVDQQALDCYQRAVPGKFARLKIAVQSEPFPAGVIAYDPGNLSEATARRFRDGMLKANETTDGRLCLSSCGITALTAVPSDYEEELATIAKAYPPPSGSSR
jgi:ABC-type phosphate/phosphonate transport system substrate-binding protein